MTSNVRSVPRGVQEGAVRTTVAVVVDDATERLLDPSLLEGLEQRPIEEVRSLRAQCQEIETGMSFLRRVVQGHVDIVAAEVRRREEGGDPADVSRLVEQLPTILAGHLRAPGLGRLPSGVGPGKVDADLEARIDAAVADLDDLSSLADDQLVAIQGRLADLEHEISERRRALFGRIDVLQAELTRRYRAGEANVESLLR
jgi:hypothetical protein